MRSKQLIATLALSAILFTGCSLKDQNAIIKVNGKAISKAKYESLIDKSINTSPFGKMGDLKANKDGFLYLMMEQQVVNQLVIEEILNQEAKKRGVKVTNKDVEQELKKIIKQMGGKDRLTETLKANNITVGQFKKDVQTQVKMKKLADSVKKTKITDADCEKYYNEHVEMFKYPDQVRASHILIGANPYQMQLQITDNGKKEVKIDELKATIEKQMKEKEDLANKIDKELKADPSKFAEYAKKYSTDEMSAKSGGDLGFFAKDKMVPEFAQAAFTAKPNTVTDVVKTQYGFHIIMVTDRKTAGTAPYKKVKTSIKDFLVSQQQVGALDKLTAAAKKKAKIEYLDERYNPDNIQKKLTKQVDDLTGGEAEKAREASKEK
jgi:parvulin-like peptidyl-prolyl isomerase